MRYNGYVHNDRVSGGIRLCSLFSLIGSLLLFLGGVSSGLGVEAARGARHLYLQYCASCHGAGMDGGNGGSLLTGVWKFGSSDEKIARVIADGLPDEGMPGYSLQLSAGEIQEMVRLIRQTAVLTPEMRASLSDEAFNDGVLDSGTHRFRLETVNGDLWIAEHGPRGGDELNLVHRMKKLKSSPIGNVSKSLEGVEGMPVWVDCGSEGDVTPLTKNSEGSYFFFQTRIPFCSIVELSYVRM